ncbi:uncharacterized protein LOC128278322 isoform X1 [Anopheles cruzii]|uniref:uncharacterized protein LOC128278322 isoform X1 n=1 Tax=Anopheles cruzii TaxID=68878 RepID=UPI0022EC7FD6|nr:uncharacterized protein LOC128278322 isoform X1 [Anopheles cruzii]
MATDNEYLENPFEEALHSVALSELLMDDEKQSLAQQFQENLRTLSDMFVNLSDEDKQKFAQEFKGKFVKTLSHLNAFSKQKKLAQAMGTGAAAAQADDLRDQFTVAGSISTAVGVLFTDGSLWPTPLGYAVLACVLLLLSFFGYKLYLSLTEKERKREEKLKAKQEKTKKKK